MDKYGYIGIETLLNFCENSKDHSVTPNDFMRMKRVRMPERKTGKWIQISPARIYECSECGQNVMTGSIYVYKFCHGCGAMMEGGNRMSRLIDGDMLIANLKRYNHETVSVDGLEALVRQMPTIPDRMKLVQQAVDTIMSTSRSYSIRDRAFRNAARLIQNAIDGKAPDFEQIPEGDEMPAERKQGKWEDIGGIIRWGCPICHHAYETKSNFCPNCGAKMEEPEDIPMEYFESGGR